MELHWEQLVVVPGPWLYTEDLARRHYYEFADEVQRFTTRFLLAIRSNHAHELAAALLSAI